MINLLDKGKKFLSVAKKTISPNRTLNATASPSTPNVRIASKLAETPERPKRSPETLMKGQAAISQFQERIRLHREQIK